MSEQLYDHDAIGQRQHARQMISLGYWMEAGEFIELLTEAEADLTATRAEVEHLRHIVTEWGERFGFLVTVSKQQGEMRAKIERLEQERQELIDQTYRLGDEAAQLRVEKMKLVQERDARVTVRVSRRIGGSLNP